MKKEWIRRILMILLACIFFTCGGIVFAAKYKYIVNNRLNRKAVQTYTVQRNVSQGTSGAPSAPASSAKTGGSGAAAGTQTEEAGIEAEAQEKQNAGSKVAALRKGRECLFLPIALLLELRIRMGG